MTAPHHFHPSILRTYDIRGIVGETLFTADARALGTTFGSWLRKQGKNKICVGYDGRLTSPELVEALIAGLIMTGCAIEATGMGPSPQLYFAVKHLQADAGIMVTGSHNPADYNGFKMLLVDRPVYGELIQELGVYAATGRMIAEEGGSVTNHAIQNDYVARIWQDYQAEKGLKVVWDCGNGAAGPVVEKLTAILPGEHILLYPEVDGTFPHHHPDPTVPANLKDLIAKVKATDADLGIAFDGDGDRIGAVDQHGRIVWGDQLLTLYAQEILARRPGVSIIADVKASQVFFDVVTSAGGKAIMSPTGHSIIKSKMKETGAALAGEMSGHIFFADGYYGYDDAIYAAMRLIDLVARSGQSLAQLVDALPHAVNTPEIRIDVADTQKFDIVKQLGAKLAQQPELQINTLDGLRVSTPDGWWLLRASNTQPALVARVEAADEVKLLKLQEMLAFELSAFSLDLNNTH